MDDLYCCDYCLREDGDCPYELTTSAVVIKRFCSIGCLHQWVLMLVEDEATSLRSYHRTRWPVLSEKDALQRGV